MKSQFLLLLCCSVICGCSAPQQSQPIKPIPAGKEVPQKVGRNIVVYQQVPMSENQALFPLGDHLPNQGNPHDSKWYRISSFTVKTNDFGEVFFEKDGKAIKVTPLDLENF